MREFRIESDLVTADHWPTELLERVERFARETNLLREVSVYDPPDRYVRIYSGHLPRILVTLHMAFSQGHFDIVSEILDKYETGELVIQDAE